MLESFWFAVFISTVLGFLAGIGIGGGSLLIMWLILVLELPPWEARVINLLFFIPAAVIACLFRRKQGMINIKTVLPAVVAGCICGAVFSRISTQIDQELLKKLFGILLILTGLRELFYKPKKQGA